MTRAAQTLIVAIAAGAILDVVACRPRGSAPPPAVQGTVGTQRQRVRTPRGAR